MAERARLGSFGCASAGRDGAALADPQTRPQLGGAADDIGKLSKGEFYFSTEGSLRPFKVRTPLCLSWHPRTRRRLRRSFRRPALNVGSSPTHYIHSRMRGVTMSGRTTSIEEAKAQFLTNWQKCRDDLAPINLRLRISRQAIG